MRPEKIYARLDNNRWKFWYYIYNANKDKKRVPLPPPQVLAHIMDGTKLVKLRD